MKTSILIIGLSFLVRTNPFFCKCESFDSLEEQIHLSEFIVTGNILAKNIIVIAGKSGNLKLTAYKVRVESPYKGIQKDKVITIYSTANPDACGFPMEINERYVIFGMKETFIPEDQKHLLETHQRKAYWISSCSGTQVYSTEFDQEVRNQLGK